MIYFALSIPIIVALLAQLTKVFTDMVKRGFSFESFYAYGGIPSGHAAFVSSTALLTGLLTSFSSPVFMLSVVLAIVVIRDAVSLRNYIGLQARTINKIATTLPDTEEYKLPIMQERVGHTPLEVTAGIFFGLIITYFLFQLV
ncbi:MAG: divergent PAP2 family protein [Patescibacteria group bacterium]